MEQWYGGMVIWNIGKKWGNIYAWAQIGDTIPVVIL